MKQAAEHSIANRAAGQKPTLMQLMPVGGIKNNDYYLERQSASESNARSYPRRLPISLKRGRGVYVEDADGRTYIDCLAGAGALALGHYHPVVTDAIQQAMAEGIPFQTLDLTTPTKDAFVEEVFSSLPKAFADNARIQFCGPSGADAIEAAIKLVKTARGRRSILAFHGAYHGMTHGALSLTGETGPKTATPGLMPEVHFLPFPHDYRCPFGLGGEDGVRAGIAYIEHVLNDSNSGIAPPAAMILEVVQGEGGVNPAPDEWLRQIRRITQEKGIPLILDEVQTGGGRTGTLYAFERAGILPDVLVLSKAIGGGLPLSLVVYHKGLDHWLPGAHAGTFRGNQLAMAAGRATLKFIRDQGLDRHAAEMGQSLQDRLHWLKDKSSCVGDIRGRGLMIGVEIVDGEREDARGPAYHPEMARFIQRECLRRGLILELGGRSGSVVRFLPPFIVTPEQINQIASIFVDAVFTAENQL